MGICLNHNGSQTEGNSQKHPYTLYTSKAQFKDPLYGHFRTIRMSLLLTYSSGGSSLPVRKQTSLLVFRIDIELHLIPISFLRSSQVMLLQTLADQLKQKHAQ